MSARKIETSSVFQQAITIQAPQTRLLLSPEAVRIHKSGIEFHSGKAISKWTEMTVTLQTPHDNHKVHCNGIVVACDGDRHAGYFISILFTGLSRQSQARLDSLARW